MTNALSFSAGRGLHCVQSFCGREAPPPFIRIPSGGAGEVHYEISTLSPVPWPYRSWRFRSLPRCVQLAPFFSPYATVSNPPVPCSTVPLPLPCLENLCTFITRLDLLALSLSLSRGLQLTDALPRLLAPAFAHYLLHGHGQKAVDCLCIDWAEKSRQGGGGSRENHPFNWRLACLSLWVTHYSNPKGRAESFYRAAAARLKRTIATWIERDRGELSIQMTICSRGK